MCCAQHGERESIRGDAKCESVADANRDDCVDGMTSYRVAIIHENFTSQLWLLSQFPVVSLRLVGLPCYSHTQQLEQHGN